jgi:cell division protein FtsL
MILRVINFIVIGALVLAAAYVYRIKYEATVQAERLAKLRDEVRRERDRIASLRAQWGTLDDPARIEELAKRFLKLKPIDPTQFDTLDHLPDQPPDYMGPGSKDPIGGMIEHLEVPVEVTGSVPPPPAAAGAPAVPSAATAPPNQAGADSP